MCTVVSFQWVFIQKLRAIAPHGRVLAGRWWKELWDGHRTSFVFHFIYTNTHYRTRIFSSSSFTGNVTELTKVTKQKRRKKRKKIRIDFVEPLPCMPGLINDCHVVRQLQLIMMGEGPRNQQWQQSKKQMLSMSPSDLPFPITNK